MVRVVNFPLPIRAFRGSLRRSQANCATRIFAGLARKGWLCATFAGNEEG